MASKSAQLARCQGKATIRHDQGFCIFCLSLAMPKAWSRVYACLKKHISTTLEGSFDTRIKSWFGDSLAIKAALCPPNSYTWPNHSTQSSAQVASLAHRLKTGFPTPSAHSANNMRDPSGTTAYFALSMAFWTWNKLMSLGRPPAKVITISAGRTLFQYSREPISII